MGRDRCLGHLLINSYLLVAILSWPIQNNVKILKRNTETLAHGHQSESTQRELSNKYQHDRVKMVFKNLCILVNGVYQH